LPGGPWPGRVPSLTGGPGRVGDRGRACYHPAASSPSVGGR